MQHGRSVMRGWQMNCVAERGGRSGDTHDFATVCFNNVVRISCWHMPGARIRAAVWQAKSIKGSGRLCQWRFYLPSLLSCICAIFCPPKLPVTFKFLHDVQSD
jgi:hypothetical protein